jgi:aspartate-semialdehyde dehydrogenase
MKVLVLGSNGLVGSPFPKLLGEDHIYHTRKDCDLTDEKLTKEYITYHVKPLRSRYNYKLWSKDRWSSSKYFGQ